LRKIVSFIFSLFLILGLRAQPVPVTDSLRYNIDIHPGEDSLRVKAIYQYLRANLYYTSNQQPYINEMLSISKKINFAYGIRKGLSMYVKYYGDRSDFSLSFSYADSLTSFLKNDTSAAARSEMAFLHWDMGNNYNQIGDYNKALEYFLQSAGYFEKVNNKDNAAALYGNISSLYLHTRDSVKSTEYMEKALAIAESSGDERKCAAFMNHANNLLNQGQLSKAKEYLDKIEPIVQRLQNVSYSQYYFYINGYFFQRQRDYNSAISNYRKSLQFARANKNVHQITGVMSLMFDCFIATNNLPEAKIYLDSTLLLAVQSGLKMRKKEVYDGLALWYEKKGDHKSSNTWLKRSIELNDSLMSEENNKQIASLEMRYQVAGKENEIRNLKTEKELQQLAITQKSILNYFLIAAAIVLLVVSLLVYRTYKQNQKLQQQRISELETEKQLNATEAVLKGEEQERTRLAKDLHDGLGGMLSGIKYGLQTMKGNLIMTPENSRAFERSLDMLDTSIKEMRRVAHNMMPETLVKFGLDTALRDYCNDINQSGVVKITYHSFGLEDIVLDQTVAITTYRIVQELINNTLKHAGAQTAIVQVTGTSQQLVVTVEDDGKGFDTSILKQSKGIGWMNIQHRIEFLKGKLDVFSEPQKGTSVHIEFAI
jgi:two-component system, NarL family, sensor kinase